MNDPTDQPAHKLRRLLHHWKETLGLLKRRYTQKIAEYLGWLFIPTIAIWLLCPTWAVQGASSTYVCLFFTFLVVRHSQAKGVRERVFAIVAMYLEIMVLFGLVYQVLFHYAPEDAFVFADSIREGKAHQVFLNHYNQVLELNDSLYLLSIVDAESQKAFEIQQHKHAVHILMVGSDEYFEPLPGGYLLRFIQGCDPHGTGCVWFINIRGAGKKVSIGGQDAPDFPNENRQHTGAVKRVWDAKTLEDFIIAERNLQTEIVQERSDKISELRRNVNKQTDWDYLDFLYFSAMTMTTVGYGDILPSSRASRFVVLIHAVLGIFFIGFALSFIWPKS